MTSLQELKNYLTQQNLYGEYAWTGNMDLFYVLTTADGMDRQNSFQFSPLDAKWWIEYNQEANEFIFRVGYFTHSGVAITKEYFVGQIPNCPAARYTDENAIRWINQNDGYHIQIPENASTRLPSTIIYRKNL